MWPSMRDAEGKAYTLLPPTPPPATTAASPPLRIDAALDVYDSKQRTYGLARPVIWALTVLS